MKSFSFQLVLVALALALPCASAREASPTVVAIEPQLGAAFAMPHPSHLEMIASAQMSPATQIRYAGVIYTVAVSRAGRIVYVATSDPAFKTPEGFTITSQLSQLLSTGISQPLREPGWAYHTSLPSGWHAAFTSGQSYTGSPLRPDSRVQWFFKRQ